MQLFEALAPTPTASLLLTERYRPLSISGFLGLEKPRRALAKLAARPHASAWLFSGPSGVGKTTLALALAAEIPAELHHVPSQECTVDMIERVHRRCHYVPAEGKRMHVVLVDEADQMSKAAQLALLSMLDATCQTPNTIWIFTCNATDALQDRFISRCIHLEFSSYGIAKDAAALLEGIWERESDGAPAPNFARIVKEANNNVRAALMQLQKELALA